MPQGIVTDAVGRPLDGKELSIFSDVAGGIAHDFRNILALIDSGLRLLARNADDPDQRDQIVAGIRGGVARGMQLASRLLEFSKEPDFQVDAVDVNRALRSVEPLL